MKSAGKILGICTLAVIALTESRAQDTFSIVAVDSVTGEVGSAGASCLGSSSFAPKGAYLISDLFPGKGAIHTQAQYNFDNQQTARLRMEAGDSPQQIVDFLAANDVSLSPEVRQYGIADLNSGHPRSAGYTGDSCLDYKNHITGPGYSIQGNILLGQHILDSMEARFLNTQGDLAHRLMAALQGANVVGADTRCAAPYQSSSLSSFIRVARPADTTGMMYLDLWMSYPQTFSGVVPRDPIDSLQTLFNTWKLTATVKQNVRTPLQRIRIFYEHNGQVVLDLSDLQPAAAMKLYIYDIMGKEHSREMITSSFFKPDMSFLPTGIYFYRLTDEKNMLPCAGKFYKLR
jgi:uncharacterized Ntn-hydrolase superfamily protein